jgi:hypothetical protein
MTSFMYNIFKFNASEGKEALYFPHKLCARLQLSYLTRQL